MTGSQNKNQQVKSKIIVTSALPYANSSIHIGHLAGAYLPADIYTRFQKMMGQDIIYICGTDEHGTPITLQAKEKNVSEQTIVDGFHKEIKEALDLALIEFDLFSRTSKPEHYKLSQEFFTTLYQNGFLEINEEANFFCEESNSFLPDRYIQGECPFCDNKNARGDECSQCGKWLESSKLKNPSSSLCSGKIIKKPTKHCYLKLDTLQKPLEEWFKKQTHWKPNVKNFVEGWFKEGLKPRAITRDLKWGVPVPLESDDFKDKVLYVWFDAPIGYLSMTKEWAKNIKNTPDLWKQYWTKNTPDQTDQTNPRLIHFLGKDNIPFHAIVWPAMLIGQQKNYILPHDIPANEHLTINGEKASSSKGNCLWIQDIIPSFPPDYLRFYLAVNAPENKDADFSFQAFENCINNDLVNVVGNLFQRLTAFIADRLNGKILPLDLNSLQKTDLDILQKIETTIAHTKKNYLQFRVKEAVKTILDLAREGNAYFQQYEPWKILATNKPKVQDICYIITQLLEAIAFLLSPIMPLKTREMLKAIGINPNNQTLHGGFEDYLKPSCPEGRIIKKIPILFERVEKKTIVQKEEILAKRIQGTKDLSSGAQESTAQESGGESVDENIDIQDFSKVQIRTGRILSVERVPKSDKLLKFILQVGTQERQILSGIAKSYPDISVLENKVVAFVQNLKPRKMMGYLSYGMILSAENEKGLLEVVTVSDEVGDNAKIK